MTCAVIDSNNPRFNGLYGGDKQLTTSARACISGDPSRICITPYMCHAIPLTTRAHTCISGDPSRICVTPVPRYIKEATIRIQSGRIYAPTMITVGFMSLHLLLVHILLLFLPLILLLLQFLERLNVALCQAVFLARLFQHPNYLGMPLPGWPVRQLVPSCAVIMSRSLPPCLSSNCGGLWPCQLFNMLLYDISKDGRRI
jgi:hypothetical protein